MRFLCLTIFSFVCLFPSQAVEPTGKNRKTQELDPEIAELIEKVDAKTATIETLKARFVQRKEVSLLKEPVEMGGDFYFKRQDGFRFDFDKQHDLLIVINNDETIALSPQAKKADRFKMKKRHGRLVERLLSEKIKSLTKNFQVTRQMTTEQGVTSSHLVLTPTKRRLKKRFTNIQIWVDESYMIHKIKVIKDDGDIYELWLKDVTLNGEVPSDYFQIEIPDDYQMGDRMDFLFGPGARL